MPEPSYERITCDDVEVGDLIARTRNDVFAKVVQIDEGPVSRRLHLTLTVRGLREQAQLYAEGGYHRMAESLDHDIREAEEAGYPDDAEAKRHGNIRPRRTAKLWREVVEEEAPAELNRYRCEVVFYVDAPDEEAAAIEANGLLADGLPDNDATVNRID